MCMERAKERFKVERFADRAYGQAGGLGSKVWPPACRDCPVREAVF